VSLLENERQVVEAEVQAAVKALDVGNALLGLAHYRDAVQQLGFMEGFLVAYLDEAPASARAALETEGMESIGWARVRVDELAVRMVRLVTGGAS
jgi:hypothetical protein